MNYTAYCVRCKEKVGVKDPEVVEIKSSKGTRRAVKGRCPTCNTKLSAFLKTRPEIQTETNTLAGPH